MMNVCVCDDHSHCFSIAPCSLSAFVSNRPDQPVLLFFACTHVCPVHSALLESKKRIRLYHDFVIGPPFNHTGENEFMSSLQHQVRQKQFKSVQSHPRRSQSALIHVTQLPSQFKFGSVSAMFKSLLC